MMPDQAQACAASRQAGIIFLSGAVNPQIRKAAQTLPLGVLCTPDKEYFNQVPQFRWWAADNACFAQGERFNLDTFLVWLKRYRIHRQSCLFAVAPDVLCDAAATIARSAPVLPVIRGMGFPAAFVAQDGLERLAVPWDSFDALFIGGSTEWKLSEHAARLARAAHDRGKWVHMGRVNSGRRLRRAVAMGCDSVDGTQLAFRPGVHLRRLRRQLIDMECQMPLW